MGISAQVMEVRTSAAAAAVGSRVLNPQRRLPLVVVSLPASEVSGVVDLDDLAAAAGARADVVTMTSAVVDVFNGVLPPGLGVYGDAVRVYPVSDRWASGRSPRCEVVRPGASLVDGERRIRGELDRLHPGAASRRPASPRATPAPVASFDPAGTPPSEVVRATSEEMVDAVVDLLLASNRAYPVVVVTTALRSTTTWIDPDAVAGEVAGIAWVVVVASGRLTYRLNGRLGEQAGVYGGAGRVYPPGRAWLADPTRARLRTAYDAPQGARVADLLVGDALAHAAGLGAGALAARPRERQTAHGVVVATAPPSRAAVRLQDGSMAAVWVDTVPGRITIDQLVVPGQHVTGMLDPTSRHLDIRPALLDPHAWAAGLEVGQHVLTRVEALTPASLSLSPAPGVVVDLGVDDVTGNHLDNLTDLATLDEVLPARITRSVADGGLALTLLDVDPDQSPSIAPPSLLTGGPPWITPILADPVPAAAAGGAVTSAPTTTTPVPATSAPSSMPSPRATSTAAPARPDAAAREAAAAAAVDRLVEARLSDLHAQIDALAATVRDQQEDIARQRRTIEHLKSANRAARTRTSKAAPRAQTGPLYGFADPGEQLRWEVYRTWVEQTLPDDKPRFPLPAVWHIGPTLLSTLDLEGVTRARVLAVVVAVLTGRALRETHALRTGEAGNAPQRVRADGAAAWRTYLQQATPSARRLHWWRRTDGTIELSRVVVHDDLSID